MRLREGEVEAGLELVVADFDITAVTKSILRFSVGYSYLADVENKADAHLNNF